MGSDQLITFDKVWKTYGEGEARVPARAGSVRHQVREQPALETEGHAATRRG